MNQTETTNPVTRREFVKASALATAAVSLPALGANLFHAGGTDSLRVGLIGCGGRGTGAAINALDAGKQVKLTALGDVFPHRMKQCRENLVNERKERGVVDDSNCFTGFDAYLKVINSGVDAVILTTPPHFRPAHLRAAVEAGKHVFIEKPVAVDAPGVRSVIESGALAESKKLAIVAGTQRRHETCYLEMMKRLRDGQIGKITSARVFWNQGGLWVVKREPGWNDIEWQIRNWLYFTWLSGDHIVEQHVHNLDVMNWAMDAVPLKATGLGGRQVRTQPEYGHIFDHFAISYEYPGERTGLSMCRQIDGCDTRVAENIIGTEGTTDSRSGQAQIFGKNPWRFEGDNGDPYTQEHIDMVQSIYAGKPLNEAKRIAESTLTAIMGRMSAYTGKDVTWEQAMNSQERLGPTDYAAGNYPVPPVAVPGRTPLL